MIVINGFRILYLPTACYSFWTIFIYSFHICFYFQCCCCFFFLHFRLHFGMFSLICFCYVKSISCECDHFVRFFSPGWYVAIHTTYCYIHIGPAICFVDNSPWKWWRVASTHYSRIIDHVHRIYLLLPIFRFVQRIALTTLVNGLCYYKHYDYYVYFVFVVNFNSFLNMVVQV